MGRISTGVAHPGTPQRAAVWTVPVCGSPVRSWLRGRRQRKPPEAWFLSCGQKGEPPSDSCSRPGFPLRVLSLFPQARPWRGQETQPARVSASLETPCLLFVHDTVCHQFQGWTSSRAPWSPSRWRSPWPAWILVGRALCVLSREAPRPHVATFVTPACPSACPLQSP